MFIIPMHSLNQDFQRALNTIFSAFKATALHPTDAPVYQKMMLTMVGILSL